MNCPSCNGNGQVRYNRCGLCGGSGLVSRQVYQREIDYQISARIQEGYANISRRERADFLRANPHKEDYR